MQKLLAPLVILLALVSIGGNKMKAHVDFNKDADFSSFKTFKWIDSLETSTEDTAPTVHSFIKVVIIERLVASGMKEVTENADLHVTYHTDESAALRINTTNYQYHYGAGWWVSPYWGSGMDVSGYSQGTLVIDLWDPKTEEALWRGTVEGVVAQNPRDAVKKIEKALKLLGKEWKKKYRGGS